jgi:hypothetical protein
MVSWTPLFVLGVFAFTLAVYAATVLFRAAPDRKINRRLPPILLIEGLLALGAGVEVLVNSPSAVEPNPDFAWIGQAIGILLVPLPLLYLRFLGTLETPIVRWLRRPGVDRTLLVFLPLGLVAEGIRRTRFAVAADAIGGVFILGGFIVISIYGIVASVSAWRRAAAGSVARDRARAFAYAFVARDLLWLSLFVGQPIVDSVFHEQYLSNIVLAGVIAPVTVIVYVPLIAYGVLRAQLFDIDLKVKLGISRTTAVTIALLVIFACAKVSELYLSKEYGWVAGGIAAGLMLFISPRLNRFGDKVASKALPSVQPTSSYVSFKKLEVYRAAVESAYEEAGTITLLERKILDRLRTKLNLVPQDAGLVEAEVLAGSGAPAGPSTTQP